MIDASTYFAAQRIATAAHVIRQDVVPNVDDAERKTLDAKLRVLDDAVATLLAPAQPDTMRGADEAYAESRRDVAVLESIVDQAIVAGIVAGEDIERAQIAIGNIRWWVGRP